MLARHGRAWLVAGIAGACACARGEPAGFSGFVDAPVSSVAAQIPGRVVSIAPREGDRVRKDDVLAEVDSASYEAQVAQAEANVVRAQQDLKQAEANLTAALPTVTGAAADIARARATRDQTDADFDRLQKLYDAGAISPSELDAARARALEARAAYDAAIASKSSTRGRVGVASAGVDDARAGLAVSEAALEVARAQLAQTRITSPFDGIVVSRNLEEGEWAAPGTPIVTIEDTTRPWVRLDVAETTFRTLHLDQVADIRLVALPGRNFHGRVAQIGAEGDFALDRDVKRGRPDIRTFLVRVAFDEPPPEVRPGMTAEVRLGSETRPPRRPEARR
jgi:HlyD family secretion protein